jgi:hypothetical protein
VFTIADFLLCKNEKSYKTARTVTGTATSRGRTVLRGAAPPPAYKTENELRECTGTFPVDSPPTLKLALF